MDDCRLHGLEWLPFGSEHGESYHKALGKKNIKTIRTCHPEKKRDKIVRNPARQSEHRISRTPVYPCPCEPEHIIRSCVRLGFEMYSTPPQFSCSSRVSDPIYAADADDYAALPASLLPTRLAAYRRHARRAIEPEYSRPPRFAVAAS